MIVDVESAASREWQLALSSSFWKLCFGSPVIVDPSIVAPARDQFLAQLGKLDHARLVLQLGQLQRICTLDALKIAVALHLEQKVKDARILGRIDQCTNLLGLAYGQIGILDAQHIVGQFVG